MAARARLSAEVTAMASPNSVGGVHDWNKLREVARQGYSDGIMCLAAIETVERANRDAVIIDRINQAGAGRTATLLTEGALFRLHVMLVRAFAPVRNGDLHLRAGINFLRARLTDELSPEHHADLAEAIRLFDAASTDPRLDILKHMRDKMLAHWAVPDPAKRLPQYKELFDFGRITCEIWERLSFGAGTVKIEICHQVHAYRKSAEMFWGHWVIHGSNS